MIVTRRFLDAAWVHRNLNVHQLAGLCSFVAEVYGTYQGVESIHYDVIDCPYLTVTAFVYDREGRTVIDPDRPTDLLRTRAEIDIRCDLPAWWQPTVETAA